ncbi:MAG TPA: sigma-70 family RNA polymerase sigma factor [Blastocatellia bacterium]|jgi:RNA polymerase sigma-70 factor (ECF subfamily)|nr:sigma-70 family RNA polymerase sigma factor [Blastocatellia bacterium]
MSEMASEGRLIEACQRGDREAFHELFDAHKDRVWTIALRFTGDENAARDVTQQVFLKLFTNIAGFRHESNFKTWLYRLVANECMDEFRKNRRLIPLDFFRPAFSDGRDEDCGEVEINDWRQEPLQEERLTRLEVSKAVLAALMKLKPKLRMAIVLKYFEDLSYEQMAEALGCSMGTVASRLNRGHKALARRLAHLKQ